MSALLDLPLTTLRGQAATLRDLASASGPVLVVNVASKCGLTPQYQGLEQLAKDYGPEKYGSGALTVVGVPCNQFAGQEPGSSEEIETFCSTTYGVTFPLLEKADVNGEGRHPLYAELTQAPDADGQAGDVQWNFEKFLIAPDGSVAGRFRPKTPPQAPELIAAIEGLLGS
ncbi:glutathione peroxidase [Segniliparus rugosus]|uniref:Glutathione peroxidase n=1 Tax=Segniliparus rugosus (strain ATCC BAA-974 / DSM 45345 / CCUG 50838 / CIP 108380 / JCM 13579 / CDC 945) TaxID=679197 RepID=E5XQ06_SEGRC|nr:glutathione peroxidase [Segniliparus rugosus]EFV13562.1 hypothetical protein HMPREF9336_01578 [Segniliparus rugosus ATCC BAA-974]